MKIKDLNRMFLIYNPELEVVVCKDTPNKIDEDILRAELKAFSSPNELPKIVLFFK